MTIPYLVKFKRVESESKASITDFLNAKVPCECKVECDESTTNRSIDIEGKEIEAVPFDKESDRLQHLNDCIFNFKSKVLGTMHGIELQFTDNEPADFEWKYLRRRWTTDRIFKSLEKSIMNCKHGLELG